MSIEIEVKKTKNGSLGIVLLNRPQVLNSLNLAMCRQMAEVICEWRQTPEIKCIFIHGNGEKGFCAGGDVKAVREAIVKSHSQSNAFEYVRDFFAYEYWNDFQLSLVEKPVVAWCHGLTMGGGLGLAMGANLRVATFDSVFAMPEISIGLYPDVGATWFLNRLPKGIGLFLGLTGARFSATDALDQGLMNYFVEDKMRGRVIDMFLKAEWKEQDRDNHDIAEDILSQFNQSVAQTSYLANLEKYGECGSIFEFVSMLEKEDSEAMKDNLRRLKKGSPLSVFIIFEQLQKKLSRQAAFEMEYKLSLQFSLRHDFIEGVRALLVDKDQKPNWSYKTLSSVPYKEVQSHFSDPFANAPDARVGSENLFCKLLNGSNR